MTSARVEHHFADDQHPLSDAADAGGVSLEAQPRLKDELPPASILGRVLANRYVTDAWIADGAYSVRYRADDLAIAESVCVEFLPRRAIDCFNKIRQAVDKLAALGDPNIVEVVGRGMAAGAWPFLVTEYSSPRTLRDVLDEDVELELARVVRIGSQCADALAAAHGAGVLHGALSPERVVVNVGSGQHETVKVSGFGLASLIDASPEARLSGAPEAYQYGSPEQARGQRLEAASDVYSLGAILYELVAGRPPFAGNAISVLRQHLRNAPEPASRRRGSSDLGFRVLDKIILRCLAKAPGERYPNAAALATDLARLGAALGRARSDAAGSPKDGQRDSYPGSAPERRSGVELRPAQYPPKSRVGLRKLPKVIVREA